MPHFSNNLNMSRHKHVWIRYTHELKSKLQRCSCCHMQPVPLQWSRRGCSSSLLCVRLCQFGCFPGVLSNPLRLTDLQLMWRTSWWHLQRPLADPWRLSAVILGLADLPSGDGFDWGGVSALFVQLRVQSTTRVPLGNWSRCCDIVTYKTYA